MKKYIGIIVLLLAVISGKGQKKLSVTGELRFAGKGERMLEVTYRKIGGGYQFDSTVVRDGKFRFERELSEPIIVLMGLKGNNGNQSRSFAALYLMPGEVKVNAKESFNDLKATGPGAEANAVYANYNRTANLYVDTLNRVITAVTLPPIEKEKRQKEIQDSIELRRARYLYMPYILDKSPSPVAVLALLNYAGEPVWTPRKKMQPVEIEQLLDRMPAKYQAYPSLKSLREELQVSKVTGIGQPIIDFSLKDADGKTVKLSDFKGKYVFLDFWASWCVPCRKENPTVKAQYEKYKSNGFTVLSVSMDKAEARKAWLEAIQKDGIGEWTHVVDEEGFNGKAAKSYFVKSIPTNFLIGPDGKFLGRNLYGEALEKALSNIFK